jgi:hypothetical protein
MLLEQLLIKFLFKAHSLLLVQLLVISGSGDINGKSF